MAPCPLPIYLSAPVSNLATSAPPDFETNDVRTGMALLTMSGFRPSLVNADAAPASPPAAPATPPAVPATPAAAAGAALSNESMPGTALAIFVNSSAFSLDFATPNSAPAAPAACSGVPPISFDSAVTSSGLAFAAATASALGVGTFAAVSCASSERTAGANTITAAQTIPRQLFLVM